MLMTSKMIVSRLLLTAVFIIYVTSNPIFSGRKPDTQEHSESDSVSLDSCNRASVTPLNDAQQLQLREAMADQTFLDILERFKNGENDATITSVMQTPIVTFTPQQKRQILQSCHELFAKNPNEKIQRHLQHARQVSNSNDIDDGIIEQRDVRACPPVRAYNGLVISLDENYDPVQIVQVSRRPSVRTLSVPHSGVPNAIDTVLTVQPDQCSPNLAFKSTWKYYFINHHNISHESSL